MSSDESSNPKKGVSGLADAKGKKGEKKGEARGAADVFKAVVTEQIYDKVVEGFLKPRLRWALQNDPKLYYDYCSLWRESEDLMRNEIGFFVWAVEVLGHRAKVNKELREIAEGALEHLPKATQSYMREHVKGMEFPAGFEKPPFSRSLSATWELLTRKSGEIPLLMPVLRKAREAWDKGVKAAARELGRLLSEGLPNATDSFMAGWRERQEHHRQRRHGCAHARERCKDCADARAAHRQAVRRVVIGGIAIVVIGLVFVFIKY